MRLWGDSTSGYGEKMESKRYSNENIMAKITDEQYVISRQRITCKQLSARNIRT